MLSAKVEEAAKTVCVWSTMQFTDQNWHGKWYAVKNATSLPPEAMAIESKINSDQPHKV
jgi:hypothetical protein